MKRFRVLSLIVVLSLVFAAFSPAHVFAQSEAEAPRTIVEIAAGDRNFSTLVAAVEAAGLVDTLNGEGPFTVFAPTNAAFSKLGKTTIDSLLADPEKLKGILTYHVVGGRLEAANVTSASSSKTVNGAPVAFKVQNGQAFVNNARITTTDIQAKNGVIHVIDTVILPPSLDIVDTAAGNPQFKTLVAAVQAAGLVETLKGEGPFTVFAPTDAAFNKLGKATIDALIADPEKLKGILLYHTFGSAVYSADVAKRNATATVNGADAVFSVKKGQAYINNARIVTTDLLTTNGVIHVIDTVILPPGDIVDTAAANPQFKTLVTAVQAAGLVDTLKGKGPFTIFAPTDAAFAKLPQGTVEALLADPGKLKDILLYHAYSGKVYSSKVSKMTGIKMANGSFGSVSVKNGQAYINNARILAADIPTTNGVIHVIDTVILPPSMDIVDTAAANPQFKTLVAAVQAAGLADTLKGKGPYTVFAPTDAAFAKLGQATIDSLLADPEQLKNILLYHTANGRMLSGNVLQRASLATINGSNLVFSTKNGQAFVNNARITTTDILTTNGVIHVIDTVVLPPSADIVDTAAANPQFKTLVAAVQAAGLVDTLKGEGPFTIFAPTDAAFAKLPKGTVEALLADPEQLKSILLYHAVSGKVYSGDAARLTSAKTVNGAPVTIQVKNGQVYINEARVTVTDIQTTNGVIHVIDTVLLPPQ